MNETSKVFIQLLRRKNENNNSMNNEAWTHGMFTYRVAYGTKWLLLLNHSTKFGFFEKEKADFNLQKGKFSIIKLISNTHYIKRYNSSFELLFEYPEDFPNKYNRWLQSVNPLDLTDYNTTDFPMTISIL